MLQFMPVSLMLNRAFFRKQSKTNVSDEAESWMMSMALGNARLYKIFHQVLDLSLIHI